MVSRNRKKENIKKKSFALLGAILTMFTVIPTVAAWTQYPDGGVWAYGYRSGEAYSNYYHGKKYHYSSVISRKDADSSRGEVKATKTSYATIKIVKDEKAAFYYDYD
ncbi:lactococcin 972 family bacteriocin [Streptococcus suis]